MRPMKPGGRGNVLPLIRPGSPGPIRPVILPPAPVLAPTARLLPPSLTPPRTIPRANPAA